MLRRMKMVVKPDILPKPYAHDARAGFVFAIGSADNAAQLAAHKRLVTTPSLKLEPDVFLGSGFAHPSSSTCF
jgi:hypothetical protein